MKVFGIDVIRGSVRSRTRRPMYALVKLVGGVITGESEVSSFRLFRLLDGEKPDILAVDSLQEIATDQHELFIFLQALPPSIRLVQVTGGERKETLGKVASRFGISFNRFDPFDEARTIARVAALGAGAEVIAFEDETDIVVSRHRSPGKGGWSQNRYVRKIHGGVQQRGREIEMQLSESGLRYEKRETRAFGGSSRVSFAVYARRDQVPVAAWRGADVQVRVTGKRLERIRFRSLSGKPPYLIVGIDPGTTTAIAALDLDGNLKVLESSRQMSMSGVTESLYRVGRPLVIASDVREMPYSVEKIRRAFSGVAYTPRQDMSVESKMELTAPFQYRNDHERDALAAALEAHRTYKNKFQNLLKRVPPGFDLDEVRAGIVRGQSLEQVLGDLKGREPLPEERAPVRPLEGKGDERIRILDGTVKRLRTLVQELQGDLQKKEQQAVRLQNRIKRIRSRQKQKVQEGAEVTRRDVIIQNLKRQVRQERKTNAALRRRMTRIMEFNRVMASEETAPLKVLPSLTREGIKALSDQMGIREGDILYVHRVEGWGRNAVRDLAQAGIAALVVGRPQGEHPAPNLVAIFREHQLPLVPSWEVNASMKGDQGTAGREQLRAALERWEAGQKEYEREEKARMLEHIFQEYVSERGREMKKVG